MDPPTELQTDPWTDPLTDPWTDPQTDPRWTHQRAHELRLNIVFDRIFHLSTLLVIDNSLALFSARAVTFLSRLKTTRENLLKNQMITQATQSFSQQKV